MRPAKPRLQAILKATLLSGLLCLSGGAALAVVVEQAPPSRQLDPAQVAQGHTAYIGHCASCHGADLSGGGAPPLKSPSFQSRWLNSPASVAELNGTLHLMPKGMPNSLTEETYASIKAYLLSANGYDPGSGPVRAAKSAGPTIPLPSPPESITPATTTAPTDAELLNPNDSDWPMYNRTYKGQRFSPLKQITSANAVQLEVACILPMGEPGSFMASPIIYKGTGYATTAHNVVAFDAATCEKKWTYTYVPVDRETMVTNRGVALYDGKIFRGTSDGYLLAIDAVTGKLSWNVHVADSNPGIFIGAAPIVYQGHVIVGLAGGDWGVPGHIFAFDARTGRRIWTFDTIPTGSQPGAETWSKGAKYGGGATWTSFAIDPKDELVLAPIGNPAPDFMASARPGANLYTNSVVALDAATGKLAWYEQQVPADFHDYDTAAAPVLYEQDGRRYMAVGSKDGNIYLYDRDTHALVTKTAITTIKGGDAPLIPDKPIRVCPGYFGGVEWYGPAYSPDARTMFVGSVDWCGDYKLTDTEANKPGDLFFDGSFTLAPASTRGGWLNALDGSSGRKLWSYHAPGPMIGGVTPTAGGVVLTGGYEGDFLVFDASNGNILYRFHTGGIIGGGVSTYMVGDRQYVAVASGSRGWVGETGSPTVIVFSLRK